MVGMRLNKREAGWAPIIEEETLTDGTVVYFASHPELLGVDAQGSTREEATQLFHENLSFYLQHLKANALPMPPAHFVKLTVTLGDMPNTTTQVVRSSQEFHTATVA